jgi:tetratricopeptide (TPR) repeat protein
LSEEQSKTVASATGRVLLRPLANTGLIWKMIALALLLHIVVLLLLSPRLFTSDAESPDRLFERGETELSQAHYPEAMALFQKVMDLQPKLPPVFEKAAEQHKMAERLARQYTARAAATREGATPPNETGTATTRSVPGVPPVILKAPATQPAGTPYIPPELRPK